MGNLHQICLPSLHIILQHCPTQAPPGHQLPHDLTSHSVACSSLERYPQLHAIKVPLQWAATQPSHCFRHSELRKHRRNIDHVPKPQLHRMDPRGGLVPARCGLDVVTML